MAKTKYYNKNTQKWEYAETGCIPVRGTHYWIAQDLKPLHDYISNRVMATAEVCFLTVSVTSNQPDKSVLEGLMLSVTLPDGRTAEMAAGSVIAFTEGSVTVQFPEVAGYRKPDNVSVSYAKGSVTQQVTYLAEEVTVNALVDGTASSDYTYEVSGEGIVCLTGSGTSFTGATKWLVPHGVTMTVTPSSVDGYTTSAVTHTGSGVTGSVSVEWSEIRLGVFIEDTTGKLWTSDAWDGSATANGIAVLTENCRFVVALEDGTNNKVVWGLEDWNIGLTSISDYDVAMQYYSGKDDTDLIVGYVTNNVSGSSSSDYAAGYAYKYIFPNGQNGYLGAIGEWDVFMRNLIEIDSILNDLGYEFMSSSYWASTQYADYDCWYADVYNNELEATGKEYTNYVRAFTTLKMDTI